ncbi:hypothetical protein A167_00558 [Alcanivorax sp. S71-1-4]|nr:hypothetical protein A167_00558 [Alcanivorax sp. S71-1-4]
MIRAGMMLAAALWLSGCDLGGSGDGGSGDVALLDRPVAYVSRGEALDDDGAPLSPVLREPAAFLPGAVLHLRDLASPNARERVLTANLFDGPVDIRDLSVSFDGRRLLFALRAPEIPNADDDEQPTWNIWEYDVDSQQLRRVIGNDLIAEEGQDLAPRYLPDGRILFVSTRQRQARARLLDEGKPQFAPLEETRREFAVALHVMNADGTELRQISFNPSHDLAPMVMDDGRVLTLRWDNKQNRNSLDFFALHPDGTATGLLYGSDRQNPDPDGLQFTRPRWLPNGDLLVMARENGGGWAGVPRRLAVQRFQRASQPLPGESADGAETEVLGLPLAPTMETLSAGGRVAALAPLFDGTDRYLVAWSPCRAQVGNSLRACDDDVLANPEAEEAPPAYGLWIFDRVSGTQRPVVLPQAERIISDVAVMAPRSLPPVLADGQPGAGLDPLLFEQLSGVLDIRSVFDMDGAFTVQGARPTGIDTLADYRDPALMTAAQRNVRFLRVSKAVLIPDDDVVEVPGAAFGRSAAFGMREILGYVPVEPDGSVRAIVPANVPLDIQLVDAAGQALGNRHGNWLTVRPGETLQCNGCHAPNSAVPHGRFDAVPAPLNDGAPVTGLPFPNTDPALFADAGETMAQVRARLLPQDQALRPDPDYVDIWTDPAVRAVDDPLRLGYDALATPAPATEDCLADWSTLCRAIIHYPNHIQPLWDLPREVDDNGTLVDVTCSGCHTRRDAMSQLQVAPAQLELTGDASGQQPLHMTSYRELLFPDTELTLQDGALVELLVPLIENGQPVYEVDEEGELRLDENGDPIPVMVPVQLGQRMNPGNARGSARFFLPFASGGSHAGWLSPEEIRLLSEWLDGGGQYYNDPFEVPQT